MGGGPSLKTNIDQLKDFDGIVVATDHGWDEMVKRNMEPDIVLTVETTSPSAVINKRQWHTKIGDPQIFYSDYSKMSTIKMMLQSKGYNVELFHEISGKNIPNGVFALYFTILRLKPDSIGLIGFDFEGSDRQQYRFEIMWVRFNEFMETCKIPIYNCTEGGILEHPQVKEMTLHEYITNANP